MIPLEATSDPITSNFKESKASNGMKRRRWWIAGGIAATLGVFVLATPWPTDLLAWPLTVNDSLQPADTIIVLGSGTRRGLDPLPMQAKLRTDKGIVLQQAGLAPTVIISGGKSKVTGLIESNIMAGYAIERGLASDDIILEEHSTSTRENAEESLKLMAAQELDSAIVVTSTYHSWRACKIFRKLALEIQCAASTIHAANEGLYDRLVNFRSVIREYGAIVLYAFRRYL